MPKLRVSCFSVSLDGYGAGPSQDLANPLGVGGLALHEWLFATWQPSGDRVTTTDPPKIDTAVVQRGMSGIGAWIIGRNMFGPIRGPWTDDTWRGWWGEDPPFHVPVFVLTNHPRDSFEMHGGTTFHFVTDGIESALERASEAAGDLDVRLGGGVSTVQQFLRARLVDELQLSIPPVLLGRGESLLRSTDLVALGYRVVDRVQGEGAWHITIAKA